MRAKHKDRPGLTREGLLETLGWLQDGHVGAFEIWRKEGAVVFEAPLPPVNGLTNRNARTISRLVVSDTEHPVTRTDLAVINEEFDLARSLPA